MKNSTNFKSTNSVSNSKNKKSRLEKKKHTDRNDHSEKNSVLQQDDSQRFAGIGPESIVNYFEQSIGNLSQQSIVNYSEQSPNEYLSEDVRFGLAEDISYKLRYIIHDALTKARLCGRNIILSNDLNAAFDNLNVDRPLGATSKPNWIYLNEHNIYYLDDPVVNLMNKAVEENVYTQPGCSKITRKWETALTEDVNEALTQYFKTVCFAVVSNDDETRLAVLKDIRHNHHIGPIIEWFYHFSYLLLSKDITYDGLTLYALELIRALEESVVASEIVSEKKLKLLVRLILQRLLTSATTVDVLNPMCNVLAILCDRIPIMEFVKMKISQKMSDIKNNYALPLIMTINALGKDAVKELLEPYIEFFLCRVNENEMHMSALLQTYYMYNTELSLKTNFSFYEIFHYRLIPMWKSKPNNKTSEKMEINWRNIKHQLLKTQKKFYPLKLSRQIALEEAFPERTPPIQKPNIQIRFHSMSTVNRNNYVPTRLYMKEARDDYVMLGKWTTIYNPSKGEACLEHARYLLL